MPIKLAIDDEAAFANVKKYVDDSDENLAKLKNEMRGLSSQLGESFSNIADIAAGGGKINLARSSLQACITFYFFAIISSFICICSLYIIW